MTAGVGARLHLVEPLGFELTDAHLRRAGLDYHDLADTRVHADVEACFVALDDAGAGSVWAMTGRGELGLGEVRFGPDDALMFGTETTGLPDEVLTHPGVTGRVRIPMRPGVRSMNLSNSAAVATYEAWRQLGYPGGA
ncbi:tRNA (cytidine(34)-2'-O)-methyltransferase [Georgenia sp. Z1491]|uniref:tRNA (cytidine(34)-2'-O)-methyltransferase n=1 Tax=Georgenia sp. Z1491 TaxID=3416707 RepID=UPI003CF1C3F5